ncbi:hypothetical protein [Tatumella sp. OPLPL6]|uniref:hypothetical protein n=1 Tax=Tatumella sp. OPLPL6 TaxID=1928657 RepID=UPI000C19ED50|nr:hypothetical protein [Tatumella sp. OPLPL6]PIJ42611.1 hypothetical protein BOM24_12265 [Tatumella sp. OPLPL6]
MNPWGAIIAALITAFIAFIGMIIAKENKTSEFRQAWIDNLREDVVSLIGAWRGYLDSKKEDSQLGDQADKVKFDASIELKKCANRIKLRLNSAKENRTIHEEKVFIIIDDILKGKHTGSSDDNIDNLTLYTGIVLKEEWEKVKRGERGFSTVKECFWILFILLSIILLFWLALFLISHSGFFTIPLF